ncbi:MAG: RsmD family RNA methyltransferase [Planctomycetes bacterium]|nr:RsmD family RNA methyltransferase [Planctomycetota bacterium]
MRTQIRIVAGSLRGRKLTCNVNPNLRPTPQMVREALFSLLGNAVPERPFLDVFAGTGVVGIEALSRGASRATFIERDFRLLADVERHLRQFGIFDQAVLARADVYRWAERWQPPAEPVNVFISPPFADFEHRLDDLLNLIAEFQAKVAEGSVLVLQAEHGVPLDELPAREQWEDRRYGRNHLLIWVRETTEPATGPTENGKQRE